MERHLTNKNIIKKIKFRSKSERERQIPYDIIYMWNLKYDTNEPIYETNSLMDIENRLVVASGERVGWGMEWEVGLKAGVNFST